jgi:general secretion pathway protein L
MSRITAYSKMFFGWWNDGLFKGLPISCVKRWMYDLTYLIILLSSDNEIDIVWQQACKQAIRDHVIISDEKTLDFKRLIPKDFHDKKYYIELRLAKQHILFLQKTFPESIQENLAQAIRYQIDRLTPFNADNVYFDVHISAYKREKHQVISDIFIAPRQWVDALIERLKKIGIDQVDSISVTHERSSINLTVDGIPNRELHPKLSRKPLFFMLIALVMTLIAPLVYQNYLLYQVDSKITDLRESAATQLSIRDKLYEAEQALVFLKEKRANLPMALDIVETLSKEIPQNTWLKYLTIGNGILEIRGESRRALALIDVLEESTSFSDVRFNSPVALNKKNKRDKFYIQATLDAPHD